MLSAFNHSRAVKAQAEINKKRAQRAFCPDLTSRRSFDAAFAEARDMRVPAFVWCGQTYHTRTEAEEKSLRKVYIIGSLRNERVPKIASELRTHLNCEVFDDWFAAGPEADDYWKSYEQARGRTYAEALDGYAAKNVFRFDKTHLEQATDVVLVLPSGKSGHLEFGWSLGQGKRGHVLLEPDTDRWDVMYQFATGVHHTIEELKEALL